MEEYGLCCKQVENRSREIVMNRRWVQAVFHLDGASCLSSTKTEIKVEHDKARTNPEILENTSADHASGLDLDISEGLAAEMFGISVSNDEIIEVMVQDWSFQITVLPKEYQHTCKSTGLMLWESARLMASVLAANQNIVAGKKVLELGCGCGGICTMVATKSADIVVATDGDVKALDLLTRNVAANLKSPSLAKLITKRLDWGNRDHIESVKGLNDEGFEIIIGTDVTYVPEAIMPLFATAKELISSNRGIEENSEPALILCHVLRRVDEPSLLAAASQFGFRLVDRWPTDAATASQSIISTWFSDNSVKECVPSTALSIMYFYTV
ncbi:unnamed protein product [Ilex paraguariensis]|uniref:Uncharacterized protein n=1 Tax=Ilex paraguariensis TaxID=185542 RepID=A0ABC8UKD7_9AQUA